MSSPTDEVLESIATGKTDADDLEPFRWNRNGALDSWFDAFSLREPVSTSLENAPKLVSVFKPSTDTAKFAERIYVDVFGKA